MEKSFEVLKYNQPDSNGDIFLPGSITVPANKKIPVLKNFDASLESFIGEVMEVYDKDGFLCVKAKFAKDPRGLTPAIGFKRSTENKYPVELFAIGVLDHGNIDPNIKQIS